MPSPFPQWITIERSPLFPKWEVVRVEYYYVDDVCNNGGTNIYVRTEDLAGGYKQGVKVYQAWPNPPTDQAEKLTVPLNQANTYCVEKYGADFFMSGDSSFDPAKGQAGPYSIFAEGDSDKVKGLGLPLKRHVQYTVVLRRVDKPTPPPVSGHWAILNPNNHNDPQLKWVE